MLSEEDERRVDELVAQGKKGAQIVRIVGKEYKSAIYRRMLNLQKYGTQFTPKEFVRKRGPGRRVTDEMQKYLCDILDERPTIWLEELNSILVEKFGVHVSQSTISRAIKDSKSRKPRMRRRLKRDYVDNVSGASAETGTEHAVRPTQAEPAGDTFDAPYIFDLPLPSPPTMTPDPSTDPTHSHHDLALIHGLSATEVQTLTARCIEAKDRAYCPYSNFRVGCSLLLSNSSAACSARDANIVIGANVENVAYPTGTCAERVALATAVVRGARRGDIRALAVASDVKEGVGSPCGQCRQFIREFCEVCVLKIERLDNAWFKTLMSGAQPAVPVFMHDKNANYVVMTVEQLLPLSFGPEQLGT
ncbi:hypothetical protein LTR50_006310 [Elasticomyces elasticus]|nr:hypothetical protein LTR50_006310 [Elasticomyces elasticus]